MYLKFIADNLSVSNLFICPSILVSPLLIIRQCHIVKIVNAIKTPEKILWLACIIRLNNKMFENYHML